MRKSPSIPTYKKLFGLSGNQCAFPDCTQDLIVDNQVIAEVCHIEAASEGGERYNPSQTDEERASYENLILLCPTHHKITNDVEKYTVEKLKEMKANHEEKNKSNEIDVDDELASAFEETYKKQYFINLNGNQVAFSNQGGNVVINQHFSGRQYSKAKKSDPKTILENRLKLRKQFESFYKKSKEGNIIVRDINNLDDYPDNQEKDGKLTWYRVFIKELLQDGLEVYNGHSYVYVTYNEEKDEWEFAEENSENTESARVIGIIPFDWIENIDFNGEFNGYNEVPHIFIDLKDKKADGFKVLKYYISVKDGNEHSYRELEDLRKTF